MFLIKNKNLSFGGKIFFAKNKKIFFIFPFRARIGTFSSKR
jgi:hypothetical protein